MTNAEQPRARAAEARRNRQRLVATATGAFASGRPVSLEQIARDSGVGIGTLYRHFPRREALVEAVYVDQVAKLRASAVRLLARHPPEQAFRRWTRVFVDWAATKHGMVDTLRSLLASGRIEQGRMRGELVAIVALFLAAGHNAGDLRQDVSAEDVAAMFAGVLAIADDSTRRAQAVRLCGLVIDGLRLSAAGRQDTC